MQFGVCTSVNNAALLADTGIDFIEENIQRLLVPQAPTSEFAPHKAAVKAAPLPVVAANAFLPATLKCVGPDVDMPALVRYGETAIGRASELGIHTLVLGSGGARQIPAGWDATRAQAQFIDLLQRFAPFAQHYGVTIVVEALNRGECNFINSLAEGAAVVTACNHPRIRLLTDIYHMRREHEPADQIRAFAALITHAHIAEDLNRTVPGVSGDDFGAYFAELKAAHYPGIMAIEAHYGADLRADVVTGLAALRRQWR
ncbi:MAG: sugar phosphate isomerase/epimerase family protein [Roseiflexaceae bacterium]